VFNLPYNSLGNAFTEVACVEARLHLPLDVVLIQDIINWWWIQLRLYDDTLVPWKPGQSITDTNPQVLDPNHPIRKCCTPTYSPRRSLAIATREAYRSYAEIKVWCPKHQRFETWLVPWILLGQAALGLFDTDEWV
jgi:hypothetical protein